MRSVGLGSVLGFVLAVAAGPVGCASNTIGLDEGNEGNDAGTTGSDTGGQPTSSVPPNPSTTLPPPSTTSPPQPPPPGTTVASETASATSGVADTGTFDTGFPFDVGHLEVSFFGDVAPILQASCAPGCHEPGGEWPEQDLLNSPYFALVGVPSTENPAMNKVEPGSIDQSYLWHKINGTHIEAGGSGVMMPKNGPPLSPEQLDIIGIWILEGAQNN